MEISGVGGGVPNSISIVASCICLYLQPNAQKERRPGAGSLADVLDNIYPREAVQQHRRIFEGLLCT
jgi:hypothetical protein